MPTTVRNYSKVISLIGTLLSIGTNLFCQDSIQELPGYYQDQIEAILDNADSEAEFDFNDLGETFRQYLNNPLSINRANENELEALNLLSDIQISDFLQYRQSLGSLKSIYELQCIPSFDLNIIDKILPYVTIDEEQIFDTRSFSKMLINGRNELYLRSTRVLEKQKGYLPTADQGPKYQGSPNQYYVRFKHQFEQNLSYGFTLEKDAGEPFFSGVNKNGFDYSSFHLFVRNVNSHIQSIALGDYAISLGQGLIMHSGYGGGKSSFVTQIKRGGRILRPFTSVNEAAALRGLATTISLEPFTLTVFASRRDQDGNIRIDSSDNFETFQSFSSLKISGLHRTEAEIEDKRTITHQVIGASLNFIRRRLKTSLNFLNNQFDQPFNRKTQPYNQFYFRGSHLSNASLDYSYRIKNIHFFGEVATSDNGSIAQSHGALLGLSRYVDLALLFRNISPKYHALQGNPFIESSQANNEKGFYIGSQIKLNTSLWISLYADYWSHPWLRFNVDAPSKGTEHFIRLTYYKKRRLETYIQWRSELKGFNLRSENDFFNRISSRQRNYLRIHLSQKINKNIELRNRLEFSHISLSSDQKSSGFLIYQDFIYKAQRSRLSLTTRLCYFDTDDYNSRIYSYENDILYSFSIPAFYNQGIRYYFNVRYRIGPLTLETRFEQTHYRHLDQISSGNELIRGNTRTRIKLQGRYAF